MNGVGTKSLVSFVQAANGKTPAGKQDPLRRGANVRLTLIGVGSLALGALVYMLDRPAATVYLLPHALSFAGPHRWFGVLGGHLPEFIHVYGFILLTVALGLSPRRVVPICAFWWVVDSLFEIAQHPAIAPHLAAWLPNWFQHLPILDHTADYFLHGTFDPGDLVAIVLGTLVAYVTIRLIHSKEKDHVHPA